MSMYFYAYVCMYICFIFYYYHIILYRIIYLQQLLFYNSQIVARTYNRLQFLFSQASKIPVTEH